MPKYITERSICQVKSNNNIFSTRIGIYKNSSSTPLIKQIRLYMYTDGSLLISLTLDSEATKNTLHACLPLPIRTIVDFSAYYPFMNHYVVQLPISEKLQTHLTEICLILDKLDSFDDEFKLELQRTLGVNFSFSTAELNAHLDAGIIYAIEKVRQHSPWQSYELAELYKERFTAEKEVTEEQIRSYIECYALIPEADSHYKDANQNIYDFIMSLDIETVPKDFQLYLRGENLRATMKLGLFDEAQHLLPGLCGYGLSCLPFPGLTELSKDSLISQIILMATHISKTREEMEALKNELAVLKPTSAAPVSSGSFFATTTATESKKDDELPTHTSHGNIP